MSDGGRRTTTISICSTSVHRNLNGLPRSKGQDLAMTNVYDKVRYPSMVHPGSHPARMSALAHLYGRPSAPAWRCRVLEIGCGDGTNLLSLAAAAPQSQFVGFDLAESAIAR